MSEVIQGLWIGPALSLLEQLSIKSFLKNGHIYHLYAYRNVRNVPEGTVIKDANEILLEHMIVKRRRGPGKGSYGFFSDLFRYKLLMEKGGFWVDLDVICLRPFDFSKHYVFGSERAPDDQVNVASAVIRAPAGSECIRACYEGASNVDIDTSTWATTGPDMLTSKIREFQLDAFVVAPHTFAPINYWDFKKLVDPTFHFEIPGESYAIHFWNEMWRRTVTRKGFIKGAFRKLKYNKNARYGPDTLYGKLQRMYL